MVDVRHRRESREAQYFRFFKSRPEDLRTRVVVVQSSATAPHPETRAARIPVIAAIGFEMRRKSEPFWVWAATLLAAHSARAHFVPAGRFQRRMLSASVRPTSAARRAVAFLDAHAGWTRRRRQPLSVALRSMARVEGVLEGPENAFVEKHSAMRIPFRFTRADDPERTHSEIQAIMGCAKEYTPWIRLRFHGGIRCLGAWHSPVLLTQTAPEVASSTSRPSKSTWKVRRCPSASRRDFAATIFQKLLGRSRRWAWLRTRGR